MLEMEPRPIQMLRALALTRFLCALKAVSSRLKAETDLGCIISDTHRYTHTQAHTQADTHTLMQHMEKEMAPHLVE